MNILIPKTNSYISMPVIFSTSFLWIKGELDPAWLFAIGISLKHGYNVKEDI